MKKNNNMSEKLFQKVLDSMHNICEYSFIRESKNLENCVQEKQNYFMSLKEQNNELNSEIINPPEFFVLEAEIVGNSQEIALNLIKSNLIFLQKIYDYTNLLQILKLGLIKSDNLLLQKKLSSGLSDLFLNFLNQEIDNNIEKPHNVILPLLITNLLDEALENESRAEMYFSITSNIIENIPLVDLQNKIDIPSLFNFLVKHLKERKPRELNAKNEDTGLIGIFIVPK